MANPLQPHRQQGWVYNPPFFDVKKEIPIEAKEGDYIMKKILTLLFTSVLVFLLSTPVFAQQTPAKEKKENAKKQARWEGVIIRSDKDKSSLTVSQTNSHVEKPVLYDSSTKWTSQEHHSKKANNIDASEVKDGDRVICLGTWENDGAVLHATLISKRLSH